MPRSSSNLGSKMKAFATTMADLHMTFESDVQDLVEDLNEDERETVAPMVKNILNKLDMRLVKSSEDGDELDKIAQRVGAAYGTFIKLIGITNRLNEGQSAKRAGDLHAALEKTSTSFKKLVQFASDLNAT